MILHIDGNSFYASCERIFRPDLTHRPIAVLSNNDGIVIALDKMCKDLGFKRGDVYFKVKDQFENQGVEVFSSNYTLYADISGRINLIYNRFAPDVEQYSIDESFLFFPDWEGTDYSEIAQTIKDAVNQETGIPVSVGIAPTKTLAKLCNKLSKKRGGICEWHKLDKDAELQKYPVGDIWGVGRAKTELLKKQNIISALDLKRYPLDKAKKNLSIVGMRTVQELNEIPAIAIAFRETRQQIICSRSFSSAVFYIDEIITALAEYTQEAVKRLREDKLSCKYVTVYLMTNPFGEGDQYSNQASAELHHPTSFLPDIVGMAIELLRQIYRHGYKYRKVMVCLMGLEPDTDIQVELFDDPLVNEKKESLMKCFDGINFKYGRGTLRVGSLDLAKKSMDSEYTPWEMKREFLSPCYTTKLSDVPKVL
jgi:DNA polymerase V